MTKISRRAFLKHTALGAGALGLMFTGIRFGHAAGPEVFRLRILHTNDHHARIEPASVTIQSGPSVSRNFGGVARRKTLIDQLKAEGGNQLLLSAGDVFQGTLYFTQYEGIADLAFYREMGYDAMTLGNHEFNLGPAKLATFIGGAINGGTVNGIVLGGSNIEVISANVVTQNTPLAGLLKARIVKDFGGEKVGIFGLTTPETAFLSSPGPVTFTDPIATAQAQVDALQAEGVTKIIALTHLGYNQDLVLAAKVAGIDVIVGGHSHTPLRPTGDIRPMGPDAADDNENAIYPTLVTGKDGNPVLVVTDWEWGKWLGDISIGFDANGILISDSLTVNLRPIWADGLGNPARTLLPNEGAEITPNAAFKTRIDEEFKPPLEELQNTVVGTAAVVLDGDRRNVRARETNLGNLICNILLERARRDLTLGGRTEKAVALMNGGGIRTSIPTGNVTLGQVLEVLPFGNTLGYVDVTGAQLRAALEHGVSGIEDGQGRFPQIAGVRFSFDREKPVGERVQSVEIEVPAQLSLAGWDSEIQQNTFEPLNNTATYVLATNSFLQRGGDGYAVLTEGQNPIDTFLLISDLLAEYFEANPGVEIDVDGRISQVYRMRLPLIRQAA